VGVQRNAGGNVRHAIRDILILDKLFTLKEVAIVHHTDCGTLQFTNEGMREGLKAGVSKEHWADLDKIELGANTE
jgi:carbonic anhydrase